MNVTVFTIVIISLLCALVSMIGYAIKIANDKRISLKNYNILRIVSMLVSFIYIAVFVGMIMIYE